MTKVLDMLKYMAIGAILFIILMLNPVLLVCILGIWIVIIVVSHLKQNKQYSLLILSCIAIFIRIVTAAKIDTPIVSDFATYFKAAQLFAEGESFVEPGGVLFDVGLQYRNCYSLWLFVKDMQFSPFS